MRIRESNRMRKFLIFLITSLLFLVLIGCNGQTSKPDADQNNQNNQNNQETENKSDNSVIKYFSTLHVKAGETVTLDGNYTLKDRIVINAGSSSRSLSDSTTKYFRTEKNNIIICPDENNKITFNPSELGITEDCDILIGSFINKNDLTLTVQERAELSLNNFYDEYYSIDFSQEPWSSLDRSNVYIRQKSITGYKSYTALCKQGTYQDSKKSIDFSGNDSIGLYQFYNGVTKLGIDQDCSLFIQNPIVLNKIGEEKPITSEFSVVEVYPEAGKELCVVVSGVNDEAMEALFRSKTAAKTNPILVSGGYNTSKGAVPYYFSDKNEVVYYVGKLTEPRAFDIDFSDCFNYLNADEIKVSLKAKSDYPEVCSYDEYTDVSKIPAEGLTINKPDSSSKYVTLVFKGNGITLGTIKNTSIRNTMYYYEDRGYGSSRFSDGDFEINSKGDFILYVITENNIKGENAGILFPREKLVIERGHNYVYTSQDNGGMYKCNLHADCLSYKTSDLFKDTIRQGKYNTSDSFGEYGELFITNGHFTGSNLKGSFSNSTGNQTTDGSFGITTTYSDLVFKFEIQEFNYQSDSVRSLKGRVIIQQGGEVKLEKNDVVFSYY